MRFLELRVPPVIVAAVVAGVMWLGRQLVPAASFQLPLRWAWVTLVAASAVFVAAVAVRTFARAETTVNPLDPEAAEKLVTGGIFRHSRNPMYVGITLVLLAFGLGLQNAVAILLVVLFPLYMTRFQIIPEERVLKAKFGADYEAYCGAVRRWL